MNFAMKTFLPIVCLGLFPALSVNLLGQSSPPEPLELRQASATVNVSSYQRVGGSSRSNSTVGSPPSASVSGAASDRQYGSVMSFGGGIPIAGSPSNQPTLNTNRSLLDNAVSLNLPRLGGKNPTHVLLRARIGGPVATGAAVGAIKAVADVRSPQ